MAIPSADYYADSTLHGNYQYVTLEEIINNYIMSRDEDDNTISTPRYKILYQAKRALRELYYDVVGEVRAVELELNPNSLTVILPPDFVNYVRISWVDANGRLYPMARDNKMTVANVYLQDNEFNLLFDDDGCVLQGSDKLNVEGNTQIDADIDVGSLRRYDFCNNLYLPNQDMSKVFVNGKYRIDRSSGLIHFGSRVGGKDIVLEYISDGLYTGCEGRAEAEIRVNKFAEQAMLDFIYYNLIKNRNKIPGNEKIRARKEYYNQRRVAKSRINSIRIDEILQVFKGDSRVIK